MGIAEVRSISRLTAQRGSAVLLAVSLVVLVWLGAPPQAHGALPPDVVVIMVDDQPKGEIDAMPIVSSEIQGKGVDLTNGLIPTSLCCPSRSSFLTGNYAHTTGVYTNDSAHYGGWPTFHDTGDENLTLATQLDALGYHTGLFGKYMNEFNAFVPAGYIPPGWDSFDYLSPADGGDGAYYDYSINGTDPSGPYLEAPEDYSTDVLSTYATNFVASTPADQPLFLYFAPFGPHGPVTPAPRDIGTWPLEPASAIGALNEEDVSDKPAWVQDNLPLDEMQMRQTLTDQHEVSMSLDDATGAIIDALGSRIDNTLFIYLSDNGYMLGAHRIFGKDVPYTRSTEVPMFVRWDGHIAAGSVNNRVTTNSDLTATIAEATGITGWSMEGRSLLSTKRGGTVLEQTDFSDHPAYCGYRTQRYLYVQYTYGQGKELYDYATDPDELTNIVSDPAYASVAKSLRHKTRVSCQPVPPGFSWTAIP